MIQIPSNATWKKNGITIAGGRGRGDALNQLNHPCGLAVDDDGTVFIADTYNHRIVAWKQGNNTTGRVVAGGNGQGGGMNQLDGPSDVLIDKETDSLIICDYGNGRVMRWSRRNGTTSGEMIIDNIVCNGLAMDDEGHLYVTDEKHEVRRYRRGEKTGTLVAGGNGKGDGFNQLNFPEYVFVDGEGAVYVSDRDNNRVMKWVKEATEGIVVAGGQGPGEDLTQLSLPYGVFVDAEGTIYVTESGNHRITRWRKGMNKGEIIAGGNGYGKGANQVASPMDLCFDRHGHLYVAAYATNGVQLFDIEKTN